MADNRFIEMACEILGIRSPADIRFEELKKLLREQFGDDCSDNYLETETGILYRSVFDSEEEQDG